MVPGRLVHHQPGLGDIAPLEVHPVELFEGDAGEVPVPVFRQLPVVDDGARAVAPAQGDVGGGDLALGAGPHRAGIDAVACQIGEDDAAVGFVGEGACPGASMTQLA